jgi:ketosteroid isomerase-like protein
MKNWRIVISVLTVAIVASYFGSEAGRVIVGTEDLRAWGQPRFDQLDMQIRETIDEIMISGDRALVRYAFDNVNTSKASGEKTRLRGKGVLIFARQPGGRWKIARNIWIATTPS